MGVGVGVSGVGMGVSWVGVLVGVLMLVKEEEMTVSPTPSSVVITTGVSSLVSISTSSPAEQAATNSKRTHKLKKRKAFIVSILFVCENESG